MDAQNEQALATQHVVPGCDAHVCHNCVLEYGDDKGKHPIWYMAKVFCPICGGTLKEAL